MVPGTAGINTGPDPGDGVVGGHTAFQVGRAALAEGIREIHAGDMEIGSLRAGKRAVPVVHIHIAADAGDGALVRVLPHLIGFAVPGLGSIPCDPAVPLVIGRVRQIVGPPVVVGINTNLVACALDDVAENLGVAQDVGLGAAIEDGLVLQIQINGQVGIIALDQAQHMVGLTAGLGIGQGVGVDVDTEGDTQTGTGIGIGPPLLVILTGHIIAVAAADDGEINVGRNGIPVDDSLMMADINAVVDILAGRVDRVGRTVAYGEYLLGQFNQLRVNGNPVPGGGIAVDLNCEPVGVGALREFIKGQIHVYCTAFDIVGVHKTGIVRALFIAVSTHLGSLVDICADPLKRQIGGGDESLDVKHLTGGQLVGNNKAGNRDTGVEGL